jgi:3',5'-cyclic AMP phosphodiesterase CpdA
MEVEIAVVSDFHCHPKSFTPWDSLLHYDASRKPANNHPVAALLRLIEQRELRATVLLVPGDLTNRVDKKGFRAGWSYCLEIASALGAKSIIATLGNHDVDYRKAVGDPFSFAKNLHPKFPVMGRANQRQFWDRGFCFITHDDLRVLVLNSVSQYADKNEVKRGCLTDRQLEDIDDELAKLSKARFQVALVHHHPIQHEILGLGADDIMKGGEVLTNLLGKHRYNLVVHGHKHHPRLIYSAGGATPMPVFAAGSLAATTEEGLLTNTRNLFHILHLYDVPPEGCVSAGTIESWEFHLSVGWQPATIGASSLPAISGFGSRVLPLDLAKRVNIWFNARVLPGSGGYFDWGDLLQELPQLRFVIPSDFQKLVQTLRDDYNLEVSKTEQDDRLRIGRLRKRVKP